VNLIERALDTQCYEKEGKTIKRRRNPDGPALAAEIERLTAQVEVMRLAGSELLRELEWVNEQLDLMPDDYAKSIVRFTAALSYRGGD
jgi:hypothetical protein